MGGSEGEPHRIDLCAYRCTLSHYLPPRKCNDSAEIQESHGWCSVTGIPNDSVAQCFPIVLPGSDCADPKNSLESPHPSKAAGYVPVSLHFLRGV